MLTITDFIRKNQELGKVLYYPGGILVRLGFSVLIVVLKQLFLLIIQLKNFMKI
jgi:hypothetical protein